MHPRYRTFASTRVEEARYLAAKPLSEGKYSRPSISSFSTIKQKERLQIQRARSFGRRPKANRQFWMRSDDSHLSSHLSRYQGLPGNHTTNEERARHTNTFLAAEPSVGSSSQMSLNLIRAPPIRPYGKRLVQEEVDEGGRLSV